MRAHRTDALLAVVLFAGCGSHAPASTACNGRDALCARAYDQVAFPGTHDAYSNVDENFGAPDQTHTMTRQLEDGVRVLHLEIYEYDDDAYLCHAFCQIGSKLLVDGFTEIRKFADDHPREVITLLMESNHVTTDAIAAALDASRLTRLIHSQPAGAPWPTLGELLSHGDRVIAFLADQTSTGGGTYPTLLSRWDWTWETPWNNQTPADFERCGADRGVMSNDLYVVDTYLEDEIIPTAAHAALVNNNPFLIERLFHCQASSGRLPNFVMVNYYEIGDLFADVDALNGFSAPPDGDADAFAPTWETDAGADFGAASTD